jgi:hypothetical protein
MLDGGERELPLALSLEGKYPTVGRPGIALCRKLPHLACIDFLPHLGKPRSWGTGRQKQNADRAVTLALEQIKPVTAQVANLALVVPAYLSRTQVGLLANLAVQTRLPALAGSVTSSLAAAWAAHCQNQWCGLALVLDVDEHALTWTALAADEPDSPRQVRVVTVQPWPQLGLRHWKDRVLDGIADRCIRQSRRDPRESAVAEQGLYEQFDVAFDAAARGQSAELVIQSAHWYQSLVLPPADIALFCKRLLARAMRNLHDLLETVQAEGPPAVVLVTATAARLPGILGALEENTGEQTAVTPLSADGVLKAAHELACRWLAEAAPCGHHDVALKLRSQGAGVRGQEATRAKTGKSKTKLPARGSKPALADDDFSVTIDD